MDKTEITELSALELGRKIKAKEIGCVEAAKAFLDAIERGDIDLAKIETVRHYVEALGGQLTVEAQFGDTRYVIA
jgi:Asp-tRNA(Asn)/Glu-tRNA(Gln) amidotransferase A subunit family amidase